MSITLLCIGGVSAMTTLLGSLPTTIRWLVHGGIIALPLLSLALLEQQRIRAAGHVLLWGCWILALLSAPSTSGNRSIGVTIVPVLIVLMGWLVAPRQAIIMAGTSIIALLGISLSEHYAWIALEGPIPPLSRWTILTGMILVTTLLTALSYRLYATRFAEQQHLAATLELVTERSPIMLASVDEKDRYRYVNRNYAAFHGKMPTDLIGTPVSLHLGPGGAQAPILAIEKGNGSARYRQLRQNVQTGTECWLEIDAQRATREDGIYDGYYAILRDITDEVRSAEQIQFMAYHDSLTSLPNRTLLADRLRQAIVRGEREDSLIAVCYLDLDGFKLLNDTWGHSTGDMVLIQLAARLQECVRGTDTVARLGGDEFVVLIGGIQNWQEISVAVGRLITAISRPISIHAGTEVGVSASIGVAVSPHDGEDPDVLLRHADQAMLMAKQSGRNRFALFDTELEQRMRTLHQIAASVEKGLADGEFRLFYQPKVNMRLGTVIGVEALIRWQHPEEGLLLPASFLPYIEGNPMASRLGQWVLGEALSQIRQWATQGLQLSVSVNISSHHLQDADFTEQLANLLDAHPDVPAERLEIEILETSAMEDVEKTARIIRASSVLGVSFALDDFGTGNASLTDFRRLPAQTLKIDKSFVRDILEDPEDLAIVKSIVALANSFERQVIAEGLESIAHGAPLLGLGCDCAQGYGIAHPMPADAIPPWIANWTAPAEWLQASR
ncbi:EAL domain-containing protein [Zoogloea sp.]|uniref:putative bifunctional diguanylate cyclase/phosphodiesterase n=1 Tax=Zoogloea sp. TaxID=49181 RepID=UPI00258934CD|nr:EAL domain-containing protein [Zoogloea sp.]MDD2667286.1 EAL domain-containing protein [Zoogloea sp.]